MISTPIFCSLLASFILFDYAGVSLGMDPGSSTPGPSHIVRRSSISNRSFLLRKFEEEINFLTAELAEASRYISAGHGAVPTMIYGNWAARLQMKLNSAYRDCHKVSDTPGVPEDYSRQWYSIGSEKRFAMHDLTTAGYPWIDLTPRSQHQSAILQSEHFQQLWRDIGNMNEDWTKLAHNRFYLGDLVLARSLYDEAMNQLEARINNYIDYSRELVSGFVRPHEREHYQLGAAFQFLKDEFKRHRLNWDRIHACIPPAS